MQLPPKYLADRVGFLALMEQMKQSGAVGGPSLIGQFGVGFYSCFMVAHSVDVISRHAGSKDTWIWSSNGNDGFTISEATKGEVLLEDGLYSHPGLANCPVPRLAQPAP